MEGTGLARRGLGCAGGVDDATGAGGRHCGVGGKQVERRKWRGRRKQGGGWRGRQRKPGISKKRAAE